MEERCFSCFALRDKSSVCGVCGVDAQAFSQSPAALPAGTLLNNQYIIGKVLGQGGFGITYLGWDRALNLKVAIKEYFPSQWASRDQSNSSVSVHSNEAAQSFQSGLEKFSEEGRTLARFHNHPGIVSVLSFFRQNNTGYLVMSFVDGITFKEYLAQQVDGRISPEVAVRVLMPVMDALCEVHEAGVLHRDISPDNIYITKSGQVKLLDFGAARFALIEDKKSLSVIYKPGFAPPEQYMSEGNQGRWTDVYALAATLYLAITGVTPAQSVERFYRDELQPPSALGVRIQPHVEAALMRALTVDFTERFQTMREFQQALHHQGTVSIPIIPGKKRTELEKKFAREETKSATAISNLTISPRLLTGVALIMIVAAAIFGGWKLFAPPMIVAEQLRGRWEMPYALDGTPIGAHWQINKDGTYTVDFTFKDNGDLKVYSQDSWSTTSKANAGLSRAGQYNFKDANTIHLTFVPLSPPSGIDLHRRDAPAATAKSTQYSLIGIWDGEIKEFGAEWKRTLTIHDSGEYELIIVGHGEGTLSAKQGLYKTKSNTDGSEDYGTYNFLDPNIEHPNRVQFIGHAVPMMMWERMLETE